MSLTPELSQAVRETLKASAVLAEQVQKSTAETELGEAEIKRVEVDLERMRQHLAALGDKSGSSAAANPIVSRLLHLEDALSAARRRAEESKAKLHRQVLAVAFELNKLN
jgi:hypothetical protein